MEIIGLAIAIAAAVFAGFNIIYAVAGRFDGLHAAEALFISYGIGVGLISLEMLLFYLAGMKFSLAGLFIPWVPLIVVNACRYLRSGSGLSFAAPGQPEAKPRGFLSAFLASGITLEVLYAFFRALIKPIEAYDAVAIYAIKSKIFFIAKAIPGNYFTELVRGFPHPDYPLNIPLFETFSYIAMRGLNDQLVKMIFPLFFVGILCLLYFAIRRFASRAYALLFTFLLASIPQFNSYASNAYQELPLAFYYLASALLLFDWIADKDDLRPLALSALMAALAGWTKNEGLLYCVINALLVLAVSVAAFMRGSKRSVYAPILYIAVIWLVLAPWIWIKRTYGICNDEINLANLNPAYVFAQLNKLGTIFYELQKQLFGPKKWLVFWPVVMLTAAFHYRKVFTGVQKYISISVILALCGYVLFYMISYVDVVFFTSKTWGRFLLHILPLLVLWLAYMLKEDVKI